MIFILQISSKFGQWGRGSKNPKILRMSYLEDPLKGNSPFGGDSSDWGDDGDEWMRKKRSLDEEEDKIVEKQGIKLTRN